MSNGPKLNKKGNFVKLSAKFYAMYPNILVSYVAIAALVAFEHVCIASSISNTRDNQSPLFTTSKFVRTLDTDSFSAVLNETQIVWLVDFYLPWCPHCRQFAPEWEEAAKVYERVDNVEFGAVDCTKETKICNREGILSYPGVKMYHVPPEAVEGIMMPYEENVYDRNVVVWIEYMLKENNIQSGIDKVYMETAEHDDSIKKEVHFGDPVEPLYDERSLDIRLKRLKDAGTTALHTFEDGFFMGTTILEGERYEAAVTWVQALATAFPMKENRDAFEKLGEAMKQQERWEQADWIKLMTRWKATANAMSYPVNLFANKDDLVLCTTLTCGLWTLFHTVTVSDVKSESMRNRWKMSEIMAAIRLVVIHFFGCEKCKRHFLKMNPKSLLEKLSLADDDSPYAVAIWLWTMHNIVNKNLSKPMWPTKLSCPHCYYTDGDEPLSLNLMKLNQDNIVDYITSIYKFDDEWKTTEQHSRVTTPTMVLIAIVSTLVAILAMLLYQYKHHISHYGFKSLKTQDHIA
ncbi:unnamed protein product [Peronospora belbahrii]|uniref:Sulfhydryl oxidase n=1 Tax=Peronospora belbahrii TaxID=622444 RepID=A0AAU9KWZ8_9STRA|nr:unnamed protein product [Peronospora belbahrii]CAH0513352.1 unnamed protein product [Peronospora belbahrii]